MYVGQNVQSAPRCATEERPDVGWRGVGRGAVNCYTRAGLAEEAEAGIFRAASVKNRREGTAGADSMHLKRKNRRDARWAHANSKKPRKRGRPPPAKRQPERRPGKPRPR